MSLINKMLKDLEVRKDGAGRLERPIFQDLHSTHGERRAGRGPWIVALTLLVFGGAALYSWNRWGNDLSRVTASPAPVATVAQAPPAIPEPPTPAVPQVQEVVPAPVVVAKPPQPAARPKPVKAPGAAIAKSSVSETKLPRDERSRAASSAEARPGQMEKTDRPYTTEEQAENTYQQALRFNAQGNAVEAERQLKALLLSQPKHVKARELLVGIHLANGRITEAQDALAQGMAQVPAHLAFRYQLARLHLERGEEARAVSLLEEARAQGSRDPELPAFLAALYQRTGRHADAVKNYQAALAAKPQEGRWWMGLGISLEAQQDSGAARDAYRRALDTGRLTANLARYAEDRLKALTTR